jgi:hypothetical protein
MPAILLGALDFAGSDLSVDPLSLADSRRCTIALLGERTLSISIGNRRSVLACRDKVVSMRSEFLGEFLEVAEHYPELERDASDARQLKIRRNRFAREGSLSHNQKDVG